MAKVTVNTIKEKKLKQEKLTMITAYDYPSARLVEDSGIDMILVGDSLGMTVLGYDTTLPVTMDEIVYHTKAVTRGVDQTFVVGDMPFMSYHRSLHETLGNAGRLLQEGGAQAVKLEGGKERATTVKALSDAGIPVLGHIGLTPQSVHSLGGYKVQGRDEEQAEKLLQDAKALEEAGAFALVLECIPAELAKKISQALSIPTIGIGAGVDCDGQVLVWHDLLGITAGKKPRFVKQYAELHANILEALKTYKGEVEGGQFPQKEHTFGMRKESITKLYS